MLAVGIIGIGIIGNALKMWLESHNPSCRIHVSDPAKGYADSLHNIDVAFVNIHVPTTEDGKQDVSPIEHIISGLPNVPVFIRTTILPGTSAMLSKITGHMVYYMPEFLSERTSVNDFASQTLVFTGAVSLLEKVFPGRKYIVMDSQDAEIAKYIHNVFGAYKVTFFNAARDYVSKMGGNWDAVHKATLLSGYINDIHTYVPGPDGKFGYGGKCFPKDVDAFAKATEETPLGELIKPLHSLNEKFRGNT